MQHYQPFNSAYDAVLVRHGVPAIYNWREVALAGGLMSCGPSPTHAYRQRGGDYSVCLLRHGGMLLVIRSPYRKPLGAGARPVHPILGHGSPCYRNLNNLECYKLRM